MAVITSYVPSSAHYGEWIEVRGADFNEVTDVLGFGTFGDTLPPYQDLVPELDYEIISTTVIRVRVPAVTAVNNSQVGVVLEAGANTVSHTGFTYLGVLPGTIAPTINSFTPIAQVPGQKVTITGQGFTGATSVKFGVAEAIFFRIVSDFVIEAYPNFTGTGIITVTNVIGSDTLDGFTLLITQIRLPDLPPLGRDATTDDLVYVWDIIREMLCQANIGQLPAGDGTGGGGGDTGNIYTALGSPFKVRSDSDNYAYDATTNNVTIQDIRLIGKSDYVVSATDVSNEFENYDSGANTGNLEYDETDGLVIIHNYKLTPGSHITIYADGVVSTAMQTYLLSVKSQIDAYEKILKPVLTLGGTVWPWRKDAALIPAGWQPCTDFKGKILIGRDATDIYDPTSNPEGLNQPVGTPLGGKTFTITKDNLPEINFVTAKDYKGGGQGTKVLSESQSQVNGNGIYTSPNLGGTSKPISKLSPVKIVEWIEYVG